MKIKRFNENKISIRKSNDQLKEEIKDAFIDLFDSYDVEINKSYKHTYNCMVVIGIPDNENGDIFNLSQFITQDPNSLDSAIEVIRSQSNDIINILTLIKDSLSKLDQSIKSSIIQIDNDEYMGKNILIHLRMYFT